MLAVVLITLLAGILIGHQFKVMVLLPASATISLISIIESILSCRWQMLVVGAGAIASLQMGYIASHGIRRLIVTTRRGRRRSHFGGSSRLPERVRFDSAPKLQGRT